MRFRPSSGMNPNAQRQDRAAVEARAEVVGGLRRRTRFTNAATRTKSSARKNIAAGLPPEGARKTEEVVEADDASKRRFREPNLETPAEVQEEKQFAPWRSQSRR